MNYVIVDDEMLARSRLKRLLDELTQWSCLAALENTNQASDFLNRHDVDVLFLDIHMPGENGLEFSRRLKKQKPKLKIVFVTAFAEFALEAFEVFAAGYLLKPIERQKLQELTEKLDSANTTVNKSIQYQQGLRTYRLAAHEIYAALAEDKLTRIYFKEGSALIEMSLKTLLSDYPELFIQIHRSSIVNKGLIEAIELRNHHHYICIKGLNESLPISRRCLSDVKNALSPS
ncbi:Response regulator VCA0850 [Pseudoalteromonas luteoviolacea B = ATCC 29581]|nr:Response regulator VCA0850 [Pseudoalteromonas luteoviolacea B = ATCC 29581]